MPSAVCNWLTSFASSALASSQRGKLIFLAIEIVLLTQPRLHRQYEEGGDERRGDDCGTDRDHSTLATAADELLLDRESVA